MRPLCFCKWNLICFALESQTFKNRSSRHFLSNSTFLCYFRLFWDTVSTISILPSGKPIGALPDPKNSLKIKSPKFKLNFMIFYGILEFLRYCINYYEYITLRESHWEDIWTNELLNSINFEYFTNIYINELLYP